MALFDVYKQWPITPVKAQGSFLWDENGKKYLDCYGGHGVISIGHNHKHWVDRIQQQMSEISFYSNAVVNNLQIELSNRLSAISGYADYALFLCNSGAEANENAIKLASFQTGRSKIVAMKKAFHGRTSGALSLTDNPKIQTPFNAPLDVEFHSKTECERLFEVLKSRKVAAVIIEGIQGVGGVNEFSTEFMKSLRTMCSETQTILILDEIQSGCGRTGHYFAHQIHGISADVITMAKGMGNGFPIAGIMVHPKLKPFYGMLGTTFGGNHLACAAALSVLDVMENENLMEHSKSLGNNAMNFLQNLDGVKEIRGKGLMIGIEFEEPMAGIQKTALEMGLFTGSSGTHTLRLLPPLNISMHELVIGLEILEEAVEKECV